MKFAYGYNRTEHDFPGFDRIFIDNKRTQRRERAEMLTLGVRAGAGDEVHVFTEGDLGAGRDLTAVKAVILEKGAKVIVMEHKKPRGRPVQFDPPSELDGYIRSLWLQPGIYTSAGVARRASDLIGQPVTRGQLHYRYGPRNTKES